MEISTDRIRQPGVAELRAGILRCGGAVGFEASMRGPLPDELGGPGSRLGIPEVVVEEVPDVTALRIQQDVL